MNNTVIHAAFEATVTSLNISIGGFQLTPAEAAKTTALLGVARKMSGLPVLPPQIKDDPFEINFTAEGNLTLQRSDMDGSVNLPFDHIDDLIVMINQCVKSQIDINTLRPQPRPTGGYEPGGGDVFEGRG